MTKVKHFLVPAITTLILAVVLSFVLLNSISTPLLAGDCGVGMCSCECPGSQCSTLFYKIPFSAFDYSSCYCSDNSDSCSGISL